VSSQVLSLRVLSLTSFRDSKELVTKINYFTYFLLMHLAFREWYRLTENISSDFRLAMGTIFSICFIASFFSKTRFPALLFAFTAMIYKLIRIFPMNSNHFAIEFFCLTFILITHFSLVAKTSPQSDGDLDKIDFQKLQLLSQVLKWVPVIVLFGSGIQKMLHGTYFNGSFFAHYSSLNPDFASFFKLMYPDLIFSRSGPFLFHAFGLLLISNLVWISEILFAILTIIPRFRIIGLAGSAFVVLFIQIVAREFLLGFVFMSLLFLFSEGLNKKIFPVFAILHIYFLASKLGWVWPIFFN